MGDRSHCFYTTVPTAKFLIAFGVVYKFRLLILCPNDSRNFMHTLKMTLLALTTSNLSNAHMTCDSSSPATLAMRVP